MDAINNNRNPFDRAGTSSFSNLPKFDPATGSYIRQLLFGDLKSQLDNIPVQMKARIPGVPPINPSTIQLPNLQSGIPITMEAVKEALNPNPQTGEPVSMSELERREQIRLGKRPRGDVGGSQNRPRREGESPPPPPPPGGNV